MKKKGYLHTRKKRILIEDSHLLIDFCRSLQEIINTEKDFIKSNAKSAQDFHRTAESIKNWSTTEGEDLNDVLGKLSLLFDSYATSQTRLNAHLSTIRQHFKSVRTREEALADLRARKRSLGSKIEGVEKKLAKMGPENKELMKTTAQLKELRGEMESLRVEVQTEEAAIGDYKRRTVKEAMGIKCGGLLELAEKLTIIAEVGKMIIEEIPMEQTHPGMPRTDYVGAMRTDQLLQEATRGLADVGFTPSGASAGVQRHDYGHQMRPSEVDDPNGDYYNSVTGNGADDTGEISRTEWQDQEREPGQESYDNGYPEERQTTPIYAQHSSSLTHPPNDPALSQDSATDQWRQSKTESHSFPAPLPISAGSRSSGTPIADQFASRSPENVQVGASNLRIVGGNESNESLDRAVSPNAIPPSISSAAMYTSNQNGGQQNTNGPNAYTPPTSQQQFATPAEDPENDDNYFQSVGSTRAAQQSVRRPLSPSSAAGGMATPSIGSHIPSSPYEAPAEGRKMTAAAFRKGFGRGPSSQYAGGSTTSLGLAQQVGDTSDSTAPLAIRKRLSAVPGQGGEAYQGGEDHHPPAPPYDAHQSIYGGLQPSDLDYAVPLQPPHQPWSGSRPNSRPSSAAGYRVPPPQQ